MDIQNLILLELTGGSYFKSDKLAEKLGVDHQVVVGGIKSLENYSGVRSRKRLYISLSVDN